MKIDCLCFKYYINININNIKYFALEKFVL